MKIRRKKVGKQEERGKEKRVKSKGVRGKQNEAFLVVIIINKEDRRENQQEERKGRENKKTTDNRGKQRAREKRNKIFSTWKETGRGRKRKKKLDVKMKIEGKRNLNKLSSLKFFNSFIDGEDDPVTLGKIIIVEVELFSIQDISKEFIVFGF